MRLCFVYGLFVIHLVFLTSCMCPIFAEQPLINREFVLSTGHKLQNVMGLQNVEYEFITFDKLHDVAQSKPGVVFPTKILIAEDQIGKMGPDAVAFTIAHELAHGTFLNILRGFPAEEVADKKALEALYKAGFSLQKAIDEMVPHFGKGDTLHSPKMERERYLKEHAKRILQKGSVFQREIFIETIKGIPKAFDDLEHGRLKGTTPQSVYDYSTLFLRTLAITQGYFVYRQRDLQMMQKALDSIRSIAGLDPGHPGLNVSQSTLARNIQPSFSPTTIFSDDFQTRSLSAWSTSGLGGISSMDKLPPFNWYAYMSPSSGTPSSMSHTFTPPQLAHIAISFDYMVGGFSDVITGHFRAGLDSSPLLNVNVPSDINLANYESFPTISVTRIYPPPVVHIESSERNYTTNTWSTFNSSCITPASGSHEIKFETVTSTTRTVTATSPDGSMSGTTTPGGPLVLVDNVKIETCQ